MSNPNLTQRENEVMEATARGLTAQEVGESLGVTKSTVEFHLERAYRKLGTNRKMLAVKAWQRLSGAAE